MTSHWNSAKRRGITIVEVVITAGVLLLLVALILPAVQQARIQAGPPKCANNLKQIGLALHAYCDAQKVFPPAIINSPDSSYIPKDVALGTTGWMLLLPFVDRRGLYDEYDFTQGCVPGSIGPSETNQRITATHISLYKCPQDIAQVLVTNNSPPGGCYNAASSNYLFGAGSRLNPLSETGNPYVLYNEAAPPYDKLQKLKSTSRGLFGHNAFAYFGQVRDGISNTIMVGETLQEHATGAAAAVVWGQGKLYGQMAVVDGLGLSAPRSHYQGVSTTTMNYPRTVPGQEKAAVNPAVLSSAHPNGVNILFGDGSVKFVDQKIDPGIYNSLFMIDDGMAIHDNF